MKIYNMLLRLPLASKVKDKLLCKFDAIEYENQLLAEQIIDLRIQLKVLQGKKINVVFLCHRPTVWRSTKSIYEYLKKDGRVKCMIVTFPQLTPFGTYDDEKADEYFDGNEDLVKGFDWKTKQFIDLKKLEPDYVFYQQGYNSIYIPEYRSNIVSKYAKICYLSYFTYMNNLANGGVDDECYQLDFLRDVSFFFAQYDSEKKYLESRLENVRGKKPMIFITGYPKYDNLTEYKESDSKAWGKKSWQGRFRIIWTPRWTTNENACHFFNYKDKLLDFCQNNQDIDFLFRPHPQAWVEWAHTGELSKREASLYRKKYDNVENATIDSISEYLSTFYHSDCLITDTSSIVPEYFLSGKPIIYCYEDGSRYQFERGKGFSDGLYWVKNWKELQNTLERLKKGEDPLREKRKQLIQECFNMKKSAGANIGNIIINDAYQNR